MPTYGTPASANAADFAEMTLPFQRRKSSMCCSSGPRRRRGCDRGHEAHDELELLHVAERHDLDGAADLRAPVRSDVVVPEDAHFHVVDLAGLHELEVDPLVAELL